MSEPGEGGEGGGVRQEIINAVRKETIGQVAKWAIAAVVILAAAAASGWWLYLKPKLSETFGGVPPGAVMAFDRSDLDEDHCPSGWVPFLEARSRTIVGAGNPGRAPEKMVDDELGHPLQGYVLRQHGGEQKHTLTIDELPPHNFPIQALRLTNTFVRANQGYAGVDSVGRTDPKASPGWPLQYTETIGGGQAHNLMPPFIALYYCRKS